MCSLFFLEGGKPKRRCLEDEILDGGPRPKFASVWRSPIESLIDEHPDSFERDFRAAATDMADALWELEEKGVTPVMPDGKVGGNAAAAINVGGKRWILVSKSGKLAKQRMDMMKDTCVVTSFDEDKWRCEYYAVSDSVLPTSDVPMHVAALNAHKRFGWSEIPGAVLHGHAIETEEEAERLGFPCSREETVFSTPEDTKALLTLMKAYPYPEHKVFIRKGHGFIIMGRDVKDALDSFRKSIKPFI